MPLSSVRCDFPSARDGSRFPFDHFNRAFPPVLLRCTSGLSPRPQLAALGELREVAGDRDGAVQFYRRALAKEEVASGKDGARVAVRLNSLALALVTDSGIPLLTRTIAIDRRVWGERHPETATAETNLSGLLLAAGRTEESACAIAPSASFL